MLYLCTLCYLDTDDDSTTDYMLNILRTPASILQKYPAVDLLICELDPLYDDGFRFCHEYL